MNDVAVDCFGDLWFGAWSSDVDGLVFEWAKIKQVFKWQIPTSAAAKP